jgi:hypothetical protein
MIKNQFSKSFFNNLRDSYINRNIEQISKSCDLIIGHLGKQNLILHPLGFYYCNLFDFCNGEKIRIHIWSDKGKRINPLMDIHNHYYNVVSYVFRGSVYNTLYNVKETKPYTHSLYEGSYDKSGKRILKKTNKKFNLNPLKKQRVAEGELYIIDKSEVHKGEVLESEFSITFVFTEKPINPNPQVFGKINGNTIYEFPLMLSDKDEINHILKKASA